MAVPAYEDASAAERGDLPLPGKGGHSKNDDMALSGTVLAERHLLTWMADEKAVYEAVKEYLSRKARQGKWLLRSMKDMKREPSMLQIY